MNKATGLIRPAMNLRVKFLKKIFPIYKPGTIDNDLKARNTRNVLRPETFPMFGVAIVT